MSNQSADDVACHYVMEGKAHELREEGEKEGGWRKGRKGKADVPSAWSICLHCSITA